MNIFKYILTLFFLTNAINALAMSRKKINLIMPSIYCAQRFYATKRNKSNNALLKFQKEILKKGSPIVDANYEDKKLFHIKTRNNNHYYTTFPHKKYSVITPKKRK